MNAAMAVITSSSGRLPPLSASSCCVSENATPVRFIAPIRMPAIAVMAMMSITAPPGRRPPRRTSLIDSRLPLCGTTSTRTISTAVADKRGIFRLQ